MANNIDMTDYQKIIFVNGLNENNNDIKGILSDEKYNFAVFFTDKNISNLPVLVNDNIIKNQTIKNIWYDGQCLTRFVGIDKNRNKININGNDIELVFDYETGLLGFAKANNLDSIELTELSWIDYDSNIRRSLYQTNLNDAINISAVNNKFDLKLKFNFNSVVNNFSPNLYTKSEAGVDNFRIINNNVITSDSTSIEYHYICEILNDTSNTASLSNKMYNIKSLYDTDKYITFTNLTFKKNTIDITGKYYWYFGVGNLTTNDGPNSGNIYTYDNPGLGWYELDTTVTSFNTPTSQLNNDHLPWIIALPVVSGFNQLQDALGPVDTVNEWNVSYITIDNIQYIVFKLNDGYYAAARMVLTITKDGSINPSEPTNEDLIIQKTGDNYIAYITSNISGVNWTVTNEDEVESIKTNNQCTLMNKIHTPSKYAFTSSYYEVTRGSQITINITYIQTTNDEFPVSTYVYATKDDKMSNIIECVLNESSIMADSLIISDGVHTYIANKINNTTYSVTLTPQEGGWYTIGDNANDDENTNHCIIIVNDSEEPTGEYPIGDNLWYFGVGGISEYDIPNSSNTYTYNNPGLGWYALDTTVNSFETPSAKLNNDHLPWVIALPVVSGFNQLQDALGPVDTVNEWNVSYITIAGIQYIVFTLNDGYYASTRMILTITKK